MMGFLALRGPNFSGRSRWLAERRKDRPWPSAAFVGPYPESALTGLASRVHEELSLAGLASAMGGPAPVLERELGLEALCDREVHVLSGGETVRTALASALLRAPGELHIDLALEQLDAMWRRIVLGILEGRADAGLPIAVADNRLTDAEVRDFDRVVDFSPAPMESGATAMMAEHGLRLLGAATAGDVQVDELSFAYRRTGHDVLEHVSVTLHRGTLCLLRGPNGAGKTTFVRLLSGTLLPRLGAIFFGGQRFEPGRSSRRFAAMAFQNPDFQWTALTVAEEFRRSGIDSAADIGSAAAAFGIPSSLLDRNPVDLPFAFKKRLGVATCLLSRKPWLVFDEPTLGQDEAWCAAFVRCVAGALEGGRGVIVISHDPRLISAFPGATSLRVQDRTITAGW